MLSNPESSFILLKIFIVSMFTPIRISLSPHQFKITRFLFVIFERTLGRCSPWRRRFDSRLWRKVRDVPMMDHFLPRHGSIRRATRFYPAVTPASFSCGAVWFPGEGQSEGQPGRDRTSRLRMLG
ncbi:hypothetical protein Hanom_Chr07g00660531 [Helianthus anomalus]